MKWRILSWGKNSMGGLTSSAAACICVIPDKPALGLGISAGSCLTEPACAVLAALVTPAARENSRHTLIIPMASAKRTKR